MPTPDQIVASLSELIQNNWLKALFALLFTFMGWWLGTWKARKEWRRREFFNRLNDTQGCPDGIAG